MAFSSRFLLGWFLLSITLAGAGFQTACGGPPVAAPDVAEPEEIPVAEELNLETSDGVGLAAWYYEIGRAHV